MLEPLKPEVTGGDSAHLNPSRVIKLSAAEQRGMTVVVWDCSHNLQLKTVKSEEEARKRVAPLSLLIEMRGTLRGFC